MNFPARGTFGKRSGRLRLHGLLGHPHHLICNTVCFLLVDVVRLADLELRPNNSGFE